MTDETYPGPWQAVVDFLRHRGVTTIFGLPADDLDLLRAVEDNPRLVLCRDQRSAMFLSIGYAMTSGGTAVCAIGKGPAVTNAVTGLLEAHSSGVPLVLLAAGTAVERRGSGAFQELDQIPLVAPLTKWAYRIDTPDRIGPALERAFLVAGSGAPGPVYLEFPDHLLTQPVPKRSWSAGTVTAEEAGEAILAAKRPLVLVGGGLRGAGHVAESLATKIGAGLFVTASGRGSVAEEHPAFLGLAGLYSPAEAAPLWEDADLLIALGTRLEETATFRPGFVAEGVPVLQVNVDPHGMSTEYPGPRVLADAGDTVRTWLATVDATPNRPWALEIAECRAASRSAVQDRLKVMAESDAIHVAEVLAAVDRVAPSDRILVQENGLQDMWSYFYPHWVCAPGGSVVPSEQTTLGFGTAAAGGVRLAAGDRPVIAFVGDGAFGMVGNEIRTLVEEKIGVLYVVLRNGGYGWLQHQYGDEPRFVDPHRALAVPPGVRHTVLTDKSQLDEVLATGVTDSAAGHVVVVEVPVSLTDAPPGITALDGDFPGGHPSGGTDDNA
ncbi:acetolactate synthase [Longispora fulva]|uniref:Acetolactate synthase-1/2/3 large subunit n=1 Tax=Longispora fulva TaxID=619741 RepID=A0A8J7KJ16_9ACTN|nr:thiamine pyrophosphate-binding protein [Longispora fulva]MBG6136444.1 acetolactate synthase-1/2/3 large subunit [Longispora fulva]GIG59611.1 acetolactate synthase [Longispora fulva]